MGRSIRWLGNFLHCGECTKDKRNNGGGGDEREKKRRSQAEAEAEASWLRNMYAESDREQSNHAIAVAAASAAAADAAVAAAQAAVAVVRLTSHGRGAMYPGDRELLAAVRIQSVFRGYLARKALRALKALVKLQALVRGYLVRKHAEVALRGVRAVMRSHSGGRRSRFAELHRRSLERFDDGRSGQLALLSGRRTSASLDSSSSGHDRSPKIVEVDTFRPSMASPRIRHYSEEKCRCYFATAQSTPRRLGSAVTAPATPAKVMPEGFPRRLSCPNYMASTRSFVAKVRSQSVPRQRLELAAESAAAAARKRNEMVETGTVGVRRSCSQISEAVSFRNAVAKKLVESSGEFKW